jgi:glycosyltransferase involved in cell wall biosynthesis/predicted O-methyltransferase YrrM
MHDAYFQGKLLTADWLTPRLSNWTRVLASKRDAAVEVLEIGSFEGRSAVFFLEHLPLARITCVESFKGSEEHTDPASPHFADMAEVERRFDQNMSPYGDRVKKRKGDSIDILPALRTEGRSFDIIYVDGDHHASSVFFDATLSWQMLAPDGILIFDDYLWQVGNSSAERPKTGIDEFLRNIGEEAEELSRDYQVIIRKKRASLTLGGRRLDEVSAGGVHAPFVSFVVINWNYGAYVDRTIESIKRQDYTNFECLVIDNDSTDNSVSVIEHSIDADHRFRLVRLEENMGQLGAALWSLDKIKGGFVTFVDADDILFANYASTHLQVHMALPQSVAFTSSAVIEMNAEGRPLTSSYDHIDLSDSGYRRGLRSTNHVLRFPAISDELFAQLSQLCVTVPRSLGGWRWGPGTSNMFRKSLLDLVKLGDGRTPYLRSADGYFNRVCHALGGSALIDTPISGYRIHTRNYFVNREGLRGLRKGTPEYAAKSISDSYESLEVFLQNADRFSWLLGDRYWSTIDQCADMSGGGTKKYYRTERGVALFMKYALKIRAAQEDNRFATEILKRFGHTRGVPIIRAGFGGAIPINIRRALIGDRLMRKVFRKLRRDGGGK